MRRMAEIRRLWAEWYLIYTPFTPFKSELPDKNNDTAVICYTWMIAGILYFSLLQIVPISCWNTGYAVRFKEKALVCYL